MMDLSWLDELLKGIDKDECEDEHGWWETSVGAEFGAAKLAELKDEITRRYQPIPEAPPATTDCPACRALTDGYGAPDRSCDVHWQEDHPRGIRISVAIAYRDGARHG